MGFAITVIGLFFIAVVLLLFLYKNHSGIHMGWFAFLIFAALFAIFFRLIPSIASGKTYIYTFHWIPSYDIDFTFYVDGLSMMFGLIITGIGALVTLYSIYYLSKNESLIHFYIYLLLFMGSMLGVVFSDHVILLYAFWELTSISSFLLIAFWYQRKKSRLGAQKSLLITVSGGMSMLVGFFMLYVMTGTFSIREMVATISQHTDHTLFLPAMLLILFGAFTKSAQFPFHFWLPEAMEAPTPVSAYLHSATMVKAGIYLVARFTPVFAGGNTWFWIVTGVGLFTLFWGSFHAIRQTDLKALLANSTIAQLGMIMSMFGMGSAVFYQGGSAATVVYTQAAYAGLFHLVNHSTFKAALFMVVGIIDHNVGTRDIRRLGGLITLMPATFVIACIGSFSMAGLPPFNGFLSKEMFFTAAAHVAQFDIFSLGTWGVLLPIVAWLGSLLTFVYCILLVFKTFLGPYRQEKLEHPGHEASPGMIIAPGILALCVIGIFFFPNLLAAYVLRPALGSVFPSLPAQDLGGHISAFHGWNTALFMTIGVVIFGILIYIFLRYWKAVYNLFPEKWSFNALYNHMIDLLDNRSKGLTNFYMTGYLRDYLIYIYLFFILAFGGVLIWTKGFIFHIEDNAAISTFDWIITLVMMAAGVAIIFARSRLTAILLNSVLGYGIVIFFVIFRAPDLALTQTVVETVTTVLFLVAYYFLPEWQRESKPRKTRGLNLLISVLVGTLFVVVALAIQNSGFSNSISSYFENSAKLTGGKNIVNAILGDFRAFDTMLEVSVLFIAGIGVYSMIKLKARKGDKHLEDQ